MLIRRAKLTELGELRLFFDTNWGSRHALINVKTFIDFYFADGEYLNFIIARETDDSPIVSACGYVLSNSTSNPDIWTTLWLTKKGTGSSIGLQIVNYMATEMGFRLVSSNNARPDTLRLYEFLGYGTAKMDHYYRLSDKEDYRVAVINHREILPYETTGYSIMLFKTPKKLLNTFDALALLNKKPYKDLDYIVKRFYNFPFYRYLVYGIVDAHQHCQSIFVMRKVDVNGTSVLRIVDLLGRYNDFAEVGHCIQDLLNDLECEYIDFYCYGLAPEILAKSGFSKRDEKDSNIIPSYLEPYESKNTEYYLFCSEIDGFVLFKADGDQDRLNIELI